MIGTEITRITAPNSTYGWLVRANDIMLDLIVKDGVFQRLDCSKGFSDLHVNDIKRLTSLRVNDMLKLLGTENVSSSSIEHIYLYMPDETYTKLTDNDEMLQQLGFSDLMVLVGKAMTS